MPSIFLSYRRADSAGYAGRLADFLNTEFGEGEVFMDVEDIPPGQDFIQAIEGRLSACGVLVAVIGPRWLEALRARVSADEDFVRHEVALAFERGLAVIPVLVGGAMMPAFHDLPGSIAELGRRQAVAMYDDRFEDSVRVLVHAIRALPTWAARFDGSWIADMHKDDRPGYTLRLDLEAMDGKLAGAVVFPEGDAVIRDGEFNGSKASFSSLSTPEFSGVPATVFFHAELVDAQLHLVAVDGSGVAKGIARRVAGNSSGV